MKSVLIVSDKKLLCISIHLIVCSVSYTQKYFLFFYKTLFSEKRSYCV